MKVNSVTVVLPFVLLFLAFCFTHDAFAQSSSINKVNVRIVTDEADAVLEILAKREAGKQITEADWQKVFSSEGYTRLKQREHSLSRSFEDADFKEFVLSDSLLKKRQALAATLAEWKQTNVEKIALRPLAYLPPTAQIRASIYPVIKPRENSFVFDLSGSPAVFLYLDPSKSREVFENSFAHELHHIGYGTACPTTAVREALAKTRPGSQKVFRWIGAFGEGFAMLAAAGGVDMHPHASSSAEDKVRWDKDVANFDRDLRTVEKFFLDLSKGTLSEEQETKTGYSYFGVQGPWYTVGWQMAVVIEKTFGRATLIESFCDQRKLLPTYNKAVQKYNRKYRTHLASWSNELLNELK